MRYNNIGETLRDRMKAIARKALQAFDAEEKAKAVEEKIGINPINYAGLSFKNRTIWLNFTLIWIDVLSDEYIQNRIKETQKQTPDYLPELANFKSTFCDDQLVTIDFIKKLDNLCQQATQRNFPDDLFEITYPPSIGPIEDLLNYLIKTDRSVNIELLHPLFLSLGLLVSKREKDLRAPSTLKKSDMEFLADFLHFLTNNPQYMELITNNIKDENALSILYIAFVPSKKLHMLEWDEKLITSCFSQSINALNEYKADPSSALAKYLG